MLACAHSAWVWFVGCPSRMAWAKPTTGCQEVGLREPTHSAGDTDLLTACGSLGQAIREGRPAPPTRPRKSRGLSQPGRETKCLLCPLLEACPPARHLCLSLPHTDTRPTGRL
nr:hypothetical protein [Kibdelosporangium sp. MJ126-NF4]